MVSLEIYWQDVLTFAVLAMAAGSLVIRAYRTAKRQQHGASCGGCPGNPENRAASDCCVERGPPDSPRPPPLS